MVKHCFTSPLILRAELFGNLENFYFITNSNDLTYAQNLSVTHNELTNQKHGMCDGHQIKIKSGPAIGRLPVARAGALPRSIGGLRKKRWGSVTSL